MPPWSDVPASAGRESRQSRHYGLLQAPPSTPTGDTSARPGMVPRTPSVLRAGYLKVLTAVFTLFNSVRVLAYLPTLWAIVKSGDSSQHSLITWLIWTGANLSMAGWLHEHNGRRIDWPVVVSCLNGLMCLVATALIVLYRVR